MSVRTCRCAAAPTFGCPFSRPRFAFLTRYLTNIYGILRNFGSVGEDVYSVPRCQEAHICNKKEKRTFLLKSLNQVTVIAAKSQGCSTIVIRFSKMLAVFFFHLVVTDSFGFTPLEAHNILKLLNIINAVFVLPSDHSSPLGGLQEGGGTSSVCFDMTSRGRQSQGFS